MAKSEERIAVLQRRPALEDLLHVVREDAVQAVAYAYIRVLAEEQVAAAVGVGIERVHQFHARVGIEVRGVGDGAENLLRVTVDVQAGNNSCVIDERFRSSAGDRQLGGEHQGGRVAEVQVEGAQIVVVQAGGFGYLRAGALGGEGAHLGHRHRQQRRSFLLLVLGAHRI